MLDFAFVGAFPWQGFCLGFYQGKAVGAKPIELKRGIFVNEARLWSEKIRVGNLRLFTHQRRGQLSYRPGEGKGAAGLIHSRAKAKSQPERTWPGRIRLEVSWFTGKEHVVFWENEEECKRPEARVRLFVLASREV